MYKKCLRRITYIFYVSIFYAVYLFLVEMIRALIMDEVYCLSGLEPNR